MIDVLTESLIDLRAAIKSPPFRTNGKSPNISTIFRWTQRGARAADGSRVKLEVVRVPGGQRTSMEAIYRFIEQLTHPGSSDSLPTPEPTRWRKKQLARNEKELREAGVL